MEKNTRFNDYLVILDGHNVLLEPEPGAVAHMSDRPVHKGLMDRLNRLETVEGGLVGVENEMRKLFRINDRVAAPLRFLGLQDEAWRFTQNRSSGNCKRSADYFIPGYLGLDIPVNYERYSEHYDPYFERFHLSPWLTEEVQELYEMGVDVVVATGNKFSSRWKLMEQMFGVLPYLRGIVTTPNYFYKGIDAKKTLVELSRKAGKKVVIADDDPLLHASVGDSAYAMFSPDSHEAVLKQARGYEDHFNLNAYWLKRVNYEMKRGDLIRACQS